MKGLIAAVHRNSVAAATGITPGEKLCAVNGSDLQDIIELSYLLAEEKLDLLIEGLDAVTRHVLIEKMPDEDLGLEFESAVFDQVSCCHNKCVFCFVDQMIPQMRSSLYVRDDDYRLSFLYGNFITMTNMNDADYDRIIKTHMSPLYISVHTTNPSVRCQMMQNKFAGDILKNIKRLTTAGIAVHTQIVLCPGYNDGEVLKHTFNDLVQLFPLVASMAVVPVGLTKHREHLPSLRLFTATEAKSIITEVTSWQQQCRQRYGKSFIYLGDEFYVLADQAFPATENYDGFPQIENGIGLSRNFTNEWEITKIKNRATKTVKNALIPVGISAFKILAPLLEQYNAALQTKHQLIPVTNDFFGQTINVTGLLTGKDILKTVQQRQPEYTRLIIPKKVLNNDNLFLDGMDFTTFKAKFNGIVETAATASELKMLLSK
ncbi:MAG: DUF512 domain-containing protein [Acidaminococcaceae bacterium]